MDADRLSAIKARVSAATPGPWRASTGRTYSPSTGEVTSVEHWISRGDDDVGIASEVCDSRTGEPSEANAAFIAHAREDVEDLVAEVERAAPALRREPTQEEGDAAEGITPPDCPTPIGAGECFVRAGGWTGRRCRVCRRWAWGGPTLCERCAATPEVA